MDLDELPGEVRLKLEESDERQLWEKAERTGLKKAAEKTGFEPYNVYSWRSEEAFIPKSFVKEFLESPSIESMKGGGRSKPISDFNIDEISDELLTRVEESVVVNSDGVPIYQQTDRGCVKRFIELLESIGGVPYSVYERDIFEVRYPRYLQQIFSSLEYELDMAATVDETGSIEDGEIRVGEEAIAVEEFYGELYSREKRLQLAIERKDSKEIEKLMAAEAARIQEAFR